MKISIMPKEKTNAFDALCELASTESWCWKAPCSTCGNYDFRYAFLQLAEGRHPKDKNWLRTSFIEKHRIYKFPHGYPKEIKESVLHICLKSNLSTIHKNSKFPDWLGFLGVVFAHCGSNSDLTYKLSKYWSVQLQDIVPKSSLAYHELNNHFYLSNDILNACEKALNGNEDKG